MCYINLFTFTAYYYSLSICVNCIFVWFRMFFNPWFFFFLFLHEDGSIIHTVCVNLGTSSVKARRKNILKCCKLSYRKSFFRQMAIYYGLLNFAWITVLHIWDNGLIFVRGDVYLSSAFLLLIIRWWDAVRNRRITFQLFWQIK